MILTPNQRAITLVFACVTALSAGTNREAQLTLCVVDQYAYSSYGPQLAAQLGLSSTETNLVGAAGNAGVYLSGPLVGILVDKRGPRSPLLLGAIFLFSGYTILRVIFNGGDEGPFQTWGIGGLALGEVLVGVGSSAALAAAANGTAKSFGPKRRGSAMASVVSCFGLSAFFYSTISHAFHGENATSTFLLILSLGCGGSTLFGAFFIRPALHASLVHGYQTIGNEEEIDALGPVLPSVGLPILSPESERSRELGDERDEDNPAPHASDRNDHINISGWNLLTTVDFWLLFSIIGLLSGIGLMYINNIGTVTRTLSPLDTDPRKVAAAQAHLVSLLSVFNCLGRLASGFVSDYFLHQAPVYLRCARVWWLVPISGLFVLSQALASWTIEVEGWFGLILPTAVTGFSYGAMFGLLPVLCIEWFGILSFSSNSGWVTIAPAVFGNAANILFGKIYDSNVPPKAPSTVVPRSAFVLSRAGTTAIDRLCLLGPECFATAFHMTTVMALMAVALSCYAGVRTTRIRK